MPFEVIGRGFRTRRVRRAAVPRGWTRFSRKELLFVDAQEGLEVTFDLDGRPMRRAPARQSNLSEHSGARARSPSTVIQSQAT